MELSLIRILPVGLAEEPPAGWDASPAGHHVEVVPELGALDDVLSALQEFEPDILLLDADSPHINTSTTTQKAVAARPGLAVIILSEDESQDAQRRAMIAGAEDYLIRPFTAEDFQSSLLAVTANRTLRKIEYDESAQGGDENGIIIGVVAGKGGLGKTTIACNLATLVARTKGKKAALVGLEAGDGAVLLSLQPERGLLDLAGYNANDGQNANYGIEWVKQFSAHHKNGLFYWTWQGLETQSGAIAPEDFFERLFETYRKAFSVTVVDFPLLTPEEATQVLPLVDQVLVVTSSSDLLALRSTRTLLDTIPYEVRGKLHLVINRADDTDMLSRDDLEETLGFPMRGEISNQPRLASDAINMGAPVVMTQPGSPFAQQLGEIAHTICGLPLPEEGETRKKRFRLFGG